MNTAFLPEPSRRIAAWAEQDPAEVRRAAEEWRKLGFSDYADYLAAWADYQEAPELHLQPSFLVPRPF